MIIFLYGQDTYRARQKLNEIAEHYKKIHKTGLNLKRLDAKEIGFQDFSDQFKITSMFDEKKLIILENVFSSLKFQEEFLENSKNLVKSEDIILIYQEGEITGKNKLFEFLKKKAKSQEFKFLGGQKLKNWVKKEFEKHQGIKINPEVLEKLVDYVGSDLWLLSNEIKKLVNYRKKSVLAPAFAKATADKGEIEVKDVELLVRPKIETDIFKTIDAIAQKDKKQALKLLHKHLEKGDSPLYLLSMINFQFRNLLIVKELIESRKTYNTILRKSGLHPFVVKKTYFQSEKFTFEELKKIYQKIFQADLDIKTGKIKPELALEMLITQV